MNWATWGPIIAGAAGTGASLYVQNRQSNKNREAQQEEAEQGRLFSEKQSLRNTALQESNLDPFRQQMAQARNLVALDLIARGRNAPTRVSVPAGMQGYVPQLSGGFSYDMNPDVREAARRIQRSVAGGETAPTMTNPANYGKTSVLNLMNPGGSMGYAGGGGSPGSGSAADGAAPRMPSAPGAGDEDLTSSVFGAQPGSKSYSLDPEDVAMNATATNAPYFANYRRRREGAGGVGAGALKGLEYGSMGGTPITMGAGAAIGAIAGAFTKNAESAYSDFYLDDARDILRQASKNELGRQLPDSAINEALAGQGLQSGNRWVGQESLDYIIQQWRNSPEAQQYRQQLARGNTMQPSYSGLFAA